MSIIVEKLKAKFSEGLNKTMTSDDKIVEHIAQNISLHLDRIAEAHASSHGDNHNSTP
ncbi:MAG: hypothetical protein N5P05_004307 (plasmid) [Chroococcopsis gigantea SAG 12.99]|jgi:hypothetical protein|nr:hypothetical protein [Chroococcopsis gigantea SAG 12.99]